MKLFLKSLLCLAVIFTFTINNVLAGELIVPDKVSQGRGFPVNYKGKVGDKVTLTWLGRNINLVLEETGNGEVAGQVLLAMGTDVKNDQILNININGVKSTKKIQPQAVKWAQVTLSVAPKYVTPAASVSAQIEKDRNENMAIWGKNSNFNSLKLPLTVPVKNSTISAVFGDKRVFNGKTRSVHRGTDYRGAVGTPIYAVADGNVVLVSPNQYYLGGHLILDHGQGVYSCYAHLSAFDVKVGDTVKAGDLVGKIGASGRVTGPHLHISLTLHGYSVDIQPFFDEELELIGGPYKPQPKPVQAQ